MKNKKTFLAIRLQCVSLAIFFGLFGFSALAQGEGWNVETLTAFGLPDTAIKDIVLTIMSWILGIISMLAIIAFAISGVQYITSAGNESQIETAKKNMVWSIVGVLVALSGLIIVRAIDTALNGDTFF